MKFSKFAKTGPNFNVKQGFFFGTYPRIELPPSTLPWRSQILEGFLMLFGVTSCVDNHSASVSISLNLGQGFSRSAAGPQICAGMLHTRLANSTQEVPGFFLSAKRKFFKRLSFMVSHCRTTFEKYQCVRLRGETFACPKHN